jgi:hypothetical protein
MWLVRLALRRCCTFVVTAGLLVVCGATAVRPLPRIFLPISHFGSEIEVVHGPQPGERVVRNPTDLLRSGTQVRVVKATAQK